MYIAIAHTKTGYVQELESIAHRSASWEVLQRGGAALTDLWDEYKSTGDAATYAKTMRKVFYAIAGPLLQSRLALSDAKTKVFVLAAHCMPWPSTLLIALSARPYEGLLAADVVIESHIWIARVSANMRGHVTKTCS